MFLIEPAMLEESSPVTKPVQLDYMSTNKLPPPQHQPSTFHAMHIRTSRMPGAYLLDVQMSGFNTFQSDKEVV